MSEGVIGGERASYVDGLFGICFLDNADDSVGNEDEKNDSGFDESTKGT